MRLSMVEVGEAKRKLFLEALRIGSFDEGDPACVRICVPPELMEKDLLGLAQDFRQVLLNRVPGWAVIAMKLEYRELDKGSKADHWKGLSQKYGQLPGIAENVREIARNLQSGVIRLPENLLEMTVDAEFSFDVDVTDNCKEILLGEWFRDDEADMVLNPAHPVFTLQDGPATAWFQLMIRKGVGYCTAFDIERMVQTRQSAHPPGESLEKSHNLPWLYLDVDFNPVRRVGFRLEEEENVRKLVYTIETRSNRPSKEAFEIALSYFA